MFEFELVFFSGNSGRWGLVLGQLQLASGDRQQATNPGIIAEIIAVCFSRLCHFKSWTGSCKGNQSFRTASPTCTTSRSWSQVLFLLCPHSWHEDVKHLGLLPSAADAHICRQRLADLTRLGQVGTGTSGTVWLVYSSVGLQIHPRTFCYNDIVTFRRCNSRGCKSPCVALLWMARTTSFKVQHKQTGARYALKRMQKSNGNNKVRFQWQTCHPNPPDLRIAVVEMLSFWGAACCTAWNWDLVWERSSIPHAHGQHPTQILPCKCLPCTVHLYFDFTPAFCFVRNSCNNYSTCSLKILPLEYLRSSPCRLVRTYTSWRSMLVVASRILDCSCTMASFSTSCSDEEKM